ncbi:hypothetical protein DTO207G8_2154 [Paecilomyces variotii]|nr:hypothetical protein DTO207G8_2154 [Paecilomyces variotii]
MLALIHFVLFYILATLSGVHSLRQVVHDESFQPDFILRVSSKEAPIACRTRLTAVVNGTTPGPAIYMQENRTTWVRVYNDFESSNLTMHWHGLAQSVSPFSDGTPQASQWPIKAGHFFDYEIRPQLGEAGTYFYHSHVDFQAVSVAGPLIVEEQSQEPPYAYDGEKTLFLTEFFNKTDKMILDGLTKPAAQYISSGDAETILVNGNSYLSLDANQSQTKKPWSTPDLSIQSVCGPEVIEVEPDKIYRIRSVGAMAQSLVSFAFEDHQNLSVIAADARYTKPVDTDHIQVGSGQRFDFLLRTKSESELQHLGKSMFWVQFETRFRPINTTSYAVLSYKTNLSLNHTIPSSPPAQTPLTLSTDVQSWLEYTLEPLQPNDFPTADQVTRQVILVSESLVARSGQFQTINNHTWTEHNEHLGGTPANDTSPSVGVPYLVNIYRKGQKAIPDYETAVQHFGGWDPRLNVYPAEVGEIIDIILVLKPNPSTGDIDPHPWHIHGGHAYDLGSGPGTYNATANEERLKGYNPVLRDTTWLYKYTTADNIYGPQKYVSQGWRAWRLRVNDPGVWMIHCHILEHMINGMQSVWVMGNATEITRGTTPDLVSGYLTYGGNAYGNKTYDPLVNHYFD